MKLNLKSKQSKDDIFKVLRAYLDGLGLGVDSIDSTRPWGGFFVIEAGDTDKFIQTYFPNVDMKNIRKYGDKLSPKILLVAPEQKLSWQYHNRRAELWRVISGPLGVVASNDNIEQPMRTLEAGDTVQFDQFMRHRLIGLGNWGIVAEIWQHTDLAQPSDEDDIIRLQDDYGR